MSTSLTNSMTRSFLLHIWLLAPESRTTNFTSALSLSVLKAAFDFYFLLMHLHSWIDRLVKKIYSKSLEHNVPIFDKCNVGHHQCFHNFCGFVASLFSSMIDIECDVNFLIYHYLNLGSSAVLQPQLLKCSSLLLPNLKSTLRQFNFYDCINLVFF